MKTKLLFSVVISLMCSFAFGQTQLTPEQWQNAKQDGTLNGKAKASPVAPRSEAKLQYKLAPNIPVTPAASSCACWQTRDSSWSIAPMSFSAPPEYRNDDDSSPLIQLPFNFCLYGTNWTDCYINNNGNVSFGAPYGTFTASGFPNASFVMVAPFWADVDTRNLLSGLPWYKITSTYMIVQWDSVGYFNAYADKLNTFQLIITDGNDPIVPGGNVSFCYKDMQWTTGDASGGVNGFGGSDAIVGANEGNGVDYIQFGSFSQPGGTYNGPLTPGSGIDWLDNQTFIFNACGSGTNVPPTASGVAVCDTIYLCIGDTLPLNVSFLSPETTQNTVITVDTTGTTGYHQVSNTPGNTATLSAYFVASSSNFGTNVITITATDNGTPTGVTTIPIVIVVLPAPVAVASNDTTICVGGSVPLNASGGVSYSWSPATNLSNPNIPNPVATPPGTTTYVVTVSNGTCTDQESVVITVQSALANAGPDTSICLGTSVQLIATGGGTYSWTPTTGLNNPNIANPIATPTVTTTYTCNVTSPIGCTDVDIATITVNPSPVALFSYLPTTPIFADSAYYFTDLSTGGVVSWVWDFGDGGNSTAQSPSHTYNIAGTYHVCLTVLSTSGCTASVCSDVIVLPRTVEAPNVFTPNGDGINDLLVFKNLEYYPNTKLQVYDRWGVLVYENGNYLNDWNGKKNGSGTECVDGTYYYVLGGINLRDTVTGFVQIIRGK